MLWIIWRFVLFLGWPVLIPFILPGLVNTFLLNIPAVMFFFFHDWKYEIKSKALWVIKYQAMSKLLKLLLNPRLLFIKVNRRICYIYLKLKMKFINYFDFDLGDIPSNSNLDRGGVLLVKLKSSNL